LKSYHPNKILILSNEFPPGPGGIGNHAWNLSRSLNKKIAVDVLTVSDYSDAQSCLLFDRKEKINITRFKRYSFSLFTFIHRIILTIKLIKKNNYTHCILTGYFSLITCSLIQIINKRINKIGILHGSELIQPKLLRRFLLINALKNLNVIIAVSQYTDGLLPINILRDQKKYIISNGVNTDLLNFQFSSKSKIKLLGYPCLVTVGSITERKGQINLIRALPEIKKKFPNVHYHCIGLAIEIKDFIDEVEKQNMTASVTIHGMIPNNQLSNIYKQSDILIMLSQNKIKSCVEGFGIAILEANLFGVPALGSKNTGIEDAIVNKKTGLLIDPYSIEEIVEGIEHLFQNKNKYSQDVRTWALDHNWSNISDKYLKVIMDA